MISPLAPHRVRFAPQNRPLESADCIVQDKDWKWQDMTWEEYEKLFEHSQKKFQHIIAGENSDYSAFQNKGGKLLLSHCAADELIFAGGTIELYHRITERLGGEDKTMDFLRFFVTPGGCHCGHFALGIPLAAGMTALMNWVEKGEAPEELTLEANNIQENPPVCFLQKVQGLYKMSEHPDFVFAQPPLCDRKQ